MDVGVQTLFSSHGWNGPLRVAEKVALLDHIADGRVRFGMGRGLSRREYGHFRGIEMDESREAAARLKAAMVMFADRAWKNRLPAIEKWRGMCREFNGAEPPPPLVCGPVEAASAFRFGGIPYEEAEASMRLFAAEVLPVLESWA